MKIKEVIRKTELTDKAIRLYIDNGLVAPSIDESYSGRKSIDFSADDVERLSNIALLRKAGFSIADIKDIIESDEKAETVVKRFIEETENNIVHETEIIEKLKNIPKENGISMKTICESLSKTVEKKKVPKEDMKLSALEKTFRTFFCSLGGLGMLLSVAGFVAYEIIIRNEFRFTTYSSLALPVVIYSGFILMFVLGFALLKTNIGQNFSSTKKSIRLLISTVIPISYIILLIFVYVFLLLILLFGAHSETEKPKNYMKLDSWIEERYSEKLYEFFPAVIPETAENDSIKYFYRHTYTLDPDFDIVAEWKLPEDEYNKEKNIEIKDEYGILQRDDWTCIYYNALFEEKSDNIPDNIFSSYGWNDKNYLIVIFAYNDKEQKVRYCASYAVDSYSTGPYYKSLDW